MPGMALAEIIPLLYFTKLVCIVEVALWYGNCVRMFWVNWSCRVLYSTYIRCPHKENISSGWIFADTCYTDASDRQLEFRRNHASVLGV